MGNIAYVRQTWAKAKEYDRKWAKYEKSGGEIPARDLAMDTLRGVLHGKILVHNHCYRADEMAIMIDVAKEFGYKIASFQHGVEAYKVADLLKENGICGALWADWYGFKMESYDAINENIAYVHNAGACAIVHSDDANGIQRLNQEAAKAMAAGKRAGSTSAKKRPGPGCRPIPQNRSEFSNRPEALKPAKWRMWFCGTAIRSVPIRGRTRYGSTERCCMTPPIPGCARSATSSSASRAKEM